MAKRKKPSPQDGAAAEDNLKEHYSGRITLRMKPEVHRKLAEIAAELSIDLTGLIGMMLNHAMPKFQELADHQKQRSSSTKAFSLFAEQTKDELRRIHEEKQRVDAELERARGKGSEAEIAAIREKHVTLNRYFMETLTNLAQIQKQIETPPFEIEIPGVTTLRVH